jgi:hypothetical protein
MQRNVILVLAALVLLLAATLAFVLLRGQPRPMPISIDAANENASEPYHQEMGCIDRLLQRNDIDANQIQPALDNCRAPGAANQVFGR